MVAIVIVSHSLRLAQGVEELALQMSGGDVPLAIAAGIDDPQNPIGTDAIAIMSAIESVWSPDGVLVLMDMAVRCLVPRWRWSCFLKSKEVQFICSPPCSERCHVSGNVCRSGAFGDGDYR